ncbi:hypothetical protein [Capillibacterium thermochitinicola]|uniref:Uncharacterized protein n=1 Tax=Capillibacterium thermochitinicola TaxID=2699427 RepID=A0A8J6I1L9_9FIRM|nr:hypothetical protein [Capillibacterium thermochitinicola]MBA2133781.1 hypothetical protein [Capillibacterium thermochitinicola]
MEMQNLKALGFQEMTDNELQEYNGGGIKAAVYALGFVMNMSPLGALIVCGLAIAGGVTVGVLVNKSND